MYVDLCLYLSLKNILLEKIHFRVHFEKSKQRAIKEYFLAKQISTQNNNPNIIPEQWLFTCITVVTACIQDKIGLDCLTLLACWPSFSHILGLQVLSWDLPPNKDTREKEKRRCLKKLLVLTTCLWLDQTKMYILVIILKWI